MTNTEALRIAKRAAQNNLKEVPDTSSWYVTGSDNAGHILIRSNDPRHELDIDGYTYCALVHISDSHVSFSRLERK